MNVKIRDTDRGASYLIKKAAEMANRTRFSVGVPEGAGSYPGGSAVVTVAAAHEFGLGNVPQRSFIRGWYDGHGNSYFGHALTNMAQRSLLGRESFDNLLAAFGARCVTEIQVRMDASIPPPLQDATVRRKFSHGSPTPEIALEDTGRLRAAIRFKVEQ